MKKTLSMLAIMSAVLVSCEKPENGVDNTEPTPDPEYSISLSPTELTFGAEGGKKTMVVTAKVGNELSESWKMTGETQWLKTIDEKFWYCESAEWCKVSKIDGYDGDEIIFEVSSFNSDNSEKKISFTFSCGYGDSTKEIELMIIQKIDDTPIIQFSNSDFEDAVIIQADLNVDNKISEAEAAYLKELDCSKKGLTDLEDIKYFTGLLSLDCSDNQLTSLDISNNIALEELRCGKNNLTSLEVSRNIALTDLDCNDNQLTTLDVSKNTDLTYLYCGDNQLTSLDVSKNTALKSLSCYNNKLTSLDLINNATLSSLTCGNNQLTILDLRNNFIPEGQDDWYNTLRCQDNPLKRIVLSKKHGIVSTDIGFIIEEYGDIITYVD